MNKNKCRYFRRHYSNKEIESLLFIHKTNSNKLKSLFCDKVFDTYSLWRNDIARRLDVQSCNKFFWSLESKCKCHNPACNKTLGVDSYHYVSLSGKHGGYKKGFNKYCPSCTLNKVWLKGELSWIKNADPEKKTAIFNKIKKWAASSVGQETFRINAVNNSRFMKIYSKTPKGIKSRLHAKLKQSKTMKQKIKDGTFTPPITNSWTHWNAIIKINGIKHKFRSSWEACFYLCNYETGIQYETLRIPYTDSAGDHKIYVADFYDMTARKVYEIKPISTYYKQQNKIQAAMEYCNKNGLTFIWINENNILSYIDIKKFDSFNIVQYNKAIKHIK